MISTHGWHKSLPCVWMCHIYRPIFVIGSLYLGLSMVGNQPKKKRENQKCNPKPTSDNVKLWTKLCGIAWRWRLVAKQWT
jgi:hypothetical protein